jgi:hypothetical protein
MVAQTDTGGRSRRGDVEAFAALVAEHEAALGRVCGRLLGEE